MSAVYGQIPVLSASGSGATSLTAFHAALVAVGLGGRNILRISSVIPPETSIDATGKATAPAGAYGDLTYCVYADQRATVVGEQAWAGIGWIQRLSGAGGLFVEHEGTSEGLVAHAIQTSLADLVRGRDGEYAAPDCVITGVICTGAPVCALVIAPYESGSWVGCGASLRSARMGPAEPEDG
ncbi:pyruvoyl-dependent arginine decarboxylase [Amycolatopsis sp. cmx-8-4]|uniref:pyruvoyl-dependent arginine decarboxylase n=1 Tax=Amycolatopsis sp. cmx-8-4 TaxID=2790947 RepID=UPI00397A30E4